jgi:hypothetical protein
MTEVVLCRISLGCAILLLFALFGDRTVWVKGHTTATDAAGYGIVATIAGVLALAALAFALWARPRLVLATLGTFMAAMAFVLAAAFAGLDVWARLQGKVWTYAAMTMSAPDARQTVYLAFGPPIFMTIAAIGAIASLGLAAEWAHQRAALPGNGYESRRLNRV